MNDFIPDSIRPVRNYKAKEDFYRIIKFKEKNKDQNQASIVIYIYYNKNFKIEVFVNKVMLDCYFKETQISKYE